MLFCACYGVEAKHGRLVLRELAKFFVLASILVPLVINERWGKPIP